MQNVSTTVRYRINAYGAGQAGGEYGTSYTNAQYPQAQQFFDKYKSEFTPYVAPAPGNDVTPPDPTPPVTPPSSLAPVTITQDPRGSLTQLTITGTSGHDSIVVSQSGSTLTIMANGSYFLQRHRHIRRNSDLRRSRQRQHYRAIVGEHLDAVVWRDLGNNMIDAGCFGPRDYVVTIGAGNDTVTGNGLNTSFWVDPSDTVHASSGGDRQWGRPPRGILLSAFHHGPHESRICPDHIGHFGSGRTHRLRHNHPTEQCALGRRPEHDRRQPGAGGRLLFPGQHPKPGAGAARQITADGRGFGRRNLRRAQFQRNNTPTYVRVDADMPVAGVGAASCTTARRTAARCGRRSWRRLMPTSARGPTPMPR